jgi:hypothetical protein
MELKAEGQFIGDCGLTCKEVEGQSELAFIMPVLGKFGGFGGTHEQSSEFISEQLDLGLATCIGVRNFLSTTYFQRFIAVTTTS